MKLSSVALAPTLLPLLATAVPSSPESGQASGLTFTVGWEHLLRDARYTGIRACGDAPLRGARATVTLIDRGQSDDAQVGSLRQRVSLDGSPGDGRGASGMSVGNDL